MVEEDRIQAAIVLHFRRTYAGLIASVPNGGLRHKREAVKLKATGILAGHPDLIIYSPKGMFLMEVKTAKGPLSDAQKVVIPELRDLGFEVAVVRSLDDALGAFKAWGLPRR